MYICHRSPKCCHIEGLPVSYMCVHNVHDMGMMRDGFQGDDSMFFSSSWFVHVSCCRRDAERVKPLNPAKSSENPFAFTIMLFLN